MSSERKQQQQTRRERREQERLIAKQKARQGKPTPSLSQRTSRRAILAGGATAIIGLGGYAIMRTLGIHPLESGPATKEFAAGYNYEHLPTREEFAETFDELSNSPLKDLLVERIQP